MNKYLEHILYDCRCCFQVRGEITSDDVGNKFVYRREIPNCPACEQDERQLARNYIVCRIKWEHCDMCPLRVFDGFLDDVIGGPTDCSLFGANKLAWWENFFDGDDSVW